MKITTSKFLSLNTRDLLKGAVVAGISAAMGAGEEAFELWIKMPAFSIQDIGYVPVVKAALIGFGAYLVKNLFTGSKVIVKVEKPETVESVEEKIEEIN